MRTAAIAFAVVTLSVGLGGQAPSSRTPVLVKNDSTLHLQAWKPGATPGTPVPAREARPRSPGQGTAPALPTYQADVSTRIARALAGAQHENRRVLVVWGSNAEKPSQDFILTMMRTPELSRTLLYEFDIVRAEFTGNEAAAAKYQATPATDGLPYLTVLDATGAVLANHPAAPFKSAGTGAAAWDGRKLNETLAKYKPTYVEAEPLLAAALDRAKRENKTLFLWFNAPW